MLTTDSLAATPTITKRLLH